MYASSTHSKRIQRLPRNQQRIPEWNGCACPLSIKLRHWPLEGKTSCLVLLYFDQEGVCSTIDLRFFFRALNLLSSSTIQISCFLEGSPAEICCIYLVHDMRKTDPTVGGNRCYLSIDRSCGPSGPYPTTWCKRHPGHTDQ